MKRCMLTTVVIFLVISILVEPVFGLTLLDVADTEYFPNKVSNIVTSPKFFLAAKSQDDEKLPDKSSLEEYSKAMEEYSKLMLSLVKITLAGFLLAFLWSFIVWLCRRSNGTVVLPLDNTTGEDKYNGQAISDSLIHEMQRIQKIHRTELEGIKSEELTFPEIRPLRESLDESLNNMGTVSLGVTTLSLDRILVAVKRFFPGDPGSSITGSIQKYEKLIRLVVRREHRQVLTWETSSEIENDQQIIDLIRDLAYKIIKDLSQPLGKAKEKKFTCLRTNRRQTKKSIVRLGILSNLFKSNSLNWKSLKKILKLQDEQTSTNSMTKAVNAQDLEDYEATVIKNNTDNFLFNEKKFKAQTIQGFKYFTEALDNYSLYTKTEQQRYLDIARDFCEKARKVEPKYKLLSQLFYNFGINYIDLKENNQAKEMLKIAFELDSQDTRPLEVLRAISTNISFHEEALADVHYYLVSEQEETSRTIKPMGTSSRLEDYQEIYKNLSHAVENNHKNYEKNNHKNYEILTYRGEIQSSMGYHGEAEKDFTQALKIKPDYPRALLGRGIVHINQGECKKAIDDFTIAETSLEQNLDNDFLVSYWIMANRGEAYRQEGKYENALKDFNEAIEKSVEVNKKNNNAFLHSQRGLTYRLMIHSPEYCKRDSWFNNVPIIWLLLRTTNCIAGILFLRKSQKVKSLQKLLQLALNDFELSIYKNPDLWQSYADRGITHHLMAIHLKNCTRDDEQPNQASTKVEEELDKALADLDHVISQEIIRDWYYYNRALVYQNLAKFKSKQENNENDKLKKNADNCSKYENDAYNDLKNAVKLAKNTHERCRHNCRNTFNLALYYLAQEKPKEARSLYLEALSDTQNRTKCACIAALNDLKDYLTLFSDKYKNLTLFSDKYKNENEPDKRKKENEPDKYKNENEHIVEEILKHLTKCTENFPSH